MTKPQWEIEFDDNFGAEVIACQEVRTVNKGLKAFIRSQIEQSYQQGVEDMRRKCVEALKEYHTDNPQDDVDRFGNGIINNVTKTINRYKPN